MDNKKFFSELPKDLLNDPATSSDTIFNAFNDFRSGSVVVKDRDNYIKSLNKNVGYKKEIPIDNAILSTFFSTDESATARSTSFYNEEDDEKLTEIRFIIHNLLPDFERDIMTLIFDYNKIQEDIGVILGLSQEMVNYYKKRAIHRILHFYHHRKIDVNEMRECLTKYMSRRQLEAMMLYFFKHNQRIVSKELGISQSAVSARLKQGLKKLKRKSRHNEDVAKYYKVFEKLTKQKSLYSSQTRMKTVIDIDNYAQFDDDNQRMSESERQQIKPLVIKTKKLKIIKKRAIKSPTRSKKIQFTHSKLKNLRDFFKR
ncbi:MAG: sigma factor-like helix-turn-helix DNA-binding protein [Nitrosarchaeum sp.]|nr:sigma factor-like helix-turn-helix DNA-binding protein [Nitrosarchaeum sp.]